MGAESLVPKGPSSILPTEDLFAYVYVLADDAISSGTVAIAARPGPAPVCTDAELLAIMLGRRCEAGFLAEVARDWAHLFWFYGFRPAIKADLGPRITRAWGIVPAAVNERGAHVLGPAHPHRGHPRRPHPDGRLPRRSVDQPA